MPTCCVQPSVAHHRVDDQKRSRSKKVHTTPSGYNKLQEQSGQAAWVSSLRTLAGPAPAHLVRKPLIPFRPPASTACQPRASRLHYPDALTRFEWRQLHANPRLPTALHPE